MKSLEIADGGKRQETKGKLCHFESRSHSLAYFEYFYSINQLLSHIEK